jgi:hypothetical protein
MFSIAKLCADHLRAFTNNHDIKLKSGHAHEFVAAFCGYKSKAAMQVDTLCPIENLDQAQIFVRMPSLFIEQRRQCLESLPPDLLDTDKLCEELSAFLEMKLSDKFFSSWQHLAESLTKEHLQQHSEIILPFNFRLYDKKASSIFNKPPYEFNLKIENTDGGVKLIVTSEYRGSPDVRFHLESIVVKVVINLQRIAGYIGYTNAEISLMDCSSQTYSQTGRPFGLNDNSTNRHLDFAGKL